MKKITTNTEDLLPTFIRFTLMAVFLFLIISEIFNFIFLKGFENPIAFCLFKLTCYCACFLLLKSSDSILPILSKYMSRMFAILDELKQQLNELNVKQEQQQQKFQFIKQNIIGAKKEESGDLAN